MAALIIIPVLFSAGDWTDIAILGGAGLVGRCSVFDLALDRETERVVVADLDFDSARKVARRANDMADRSVAEAVRVDVRDTRNACRKLGDVRAIVNGVQYYFNEDVMKIALNLGAHYLDFGGLYWMTRKQLKHNSAFKRKGLLAVPGMGAEPGMSGIFASELASGAERVDTIKIRDAWMDFTRNVPPFFVTWSIETLMDEYTMKAEVLEDARIRRYGPLSLSENYDFPEPVGPTAVYLTRHSEIATFPSSFRSKGVRNVNWMEGGPGFLEQKVLADAGFSDMHPIRIGRCSISPRKYLASLLREKGLLGYPENCRPDSYECLAVEMEGKAAERIRCRWTCIFPSRPEWGLGAAEYSVGIPGAIATRAILHGDTEAKGVVPPEIAFQPEPFIKEAERKGFRVARQMLN